MADVKRTSWETSSRLRRGRAFRVEVHNSGLEVWLYDDENAPAIRTRGLWNKLIAGEPTDGFIVGYGLRQDDGLHIEVLVGEPLNSQELSVSRWLEPQTALLRLPSGRLAVESNDSCRVGEEEVDEPGALIEVPRGDYRLTLYRTDHEALDREAISWTGPHEVVVLTPGGTTADDIAGLLPFQAQRDTSWVGQVVVDGATARGLVWFDDYWDTCFANLNAETAARMGLVTGKYLRTTVPAANISLVTVLTPSWAEGPKFPPPEGGPWPEFGFGSFTNPVAWHGAEALFCRRVNTVTAIGEKQKKLWLDAIFEVLDLEPAAPPSRIRGPLLLDAGARAYWRANLAERGYYADDPLTLSMKLDGRVTGISFDEPVGLAEAVLHIDGDLAALGLDPIGDFSFDLPRGQERVEFTVRAYGGLEILFAAVWASSESFEIFFFSRAEERWIMTGTIDEDDAARITAARPRISMAGLDDAPLADLLKAHHDHVALNGAEASGAPGSLEELILSYDDYLGAALG